jgi:hypothetical protein
VTAAFPLAGFLWEARPTSFLFSAPFLIAGGLKIFYDLTLGTCFLWSKSAKKEQKALKETSFTEIKEVETEPEQMSEELKENKENK